MVDSNVADRGRGERTGRSMYGDANNSAVRRGALKNALDTGAAHQSPHAPNASRCGPTNIARANDSTCWRRAHRWWKAVLSSADFATMICSIAQPLNVSLKRFSRSSSRVLVLNHSAPGMQNPRRRGRFLIHRWRVSAVCVVAWEDPGQRPS